MYIRRKVFSCVEERSFAEEQKDDSKKRKKWSPVDEEFVRMSNEADKKVGRAYKLSGGLLGALGGTMIPTAIEEMSDNAGKMMKKYPILPAAAIGIGSYAGLKAGKKFHEKNSHLKDDLERYEQLSPREREEYRKLKLASFQGKL